MFVVFIVTLEGRVAANVPASIFIPKNSFLATKNWSEIGGKGFICIKDWFKSIFPLT
jgi:hypothetical protein